MVRSVLVAMLVALTVAGQSAGLGRIAGSVSYWFAWDSYLGVRGELYQAE